MEQTLNYEMYLLDAQTMVNQGYDNVSVEKQLKHKCGEIALLTQRELVCQRHIK